MQDFSAWSAVRLLGKLTRHLCCSKGGSFRFPYGKGEGGAEAWRGISYLLAVNSSWGLRSPGVMYRSGFGRVSFSCVIHVSSAGQPPFAAVYGIIFLDIWREVDWPFALTCPRGFPFFFRYRVHFFDGLSALLAGNRSPYLSSACHAEDSEENCTPQCCLTSASSRRRFFSCDQVFSLALACLDCGLATFSGRFWLIHPRQEESRQWCACSRHSTPEGL